MYALILWVCVVGQPTDCRVVGLIDGFVSQEKCVKAVPLAVAGFWAMKPKDIEPRQGVLPICTTEANYLMNRFKA